MKKMILPFLLISIFLAGCASGPEPIIAGKDNCYLCKMGITDIRYAAELITTKGRVYKFDDIGCLVSYVHTAMPDKKDVKEIYLVDFSGDHTLVKAKDCFFLAGGDIHTPMNGNIAAFKHEDSMKLMSARLKAIPTSWDQLYK